jgi:hypothetical protein
MNIKTAHKIAARVQAGEFILEPEMQAAFDRLSQPDQLNSTASSHSREVLWETNLVTLD